MKEYSDTAMIRIRLEKSVSVLNSQLSVLDECGCAVAAAHLDHALNVIKQDIGGSQPYQNHLA